MMRYPVAILREFSIDLFETAGLSPDDAAVVTDCLIHADLRGHASHGLTRIPVYAERIIAGVVKARPEVTVQRNGPAFLVIDADNGPGPVVTMHALGVAIETARREGACVAVIGHSNHNGSGSFYVEKAVEAGCLAIAMTNAPPSMAVFGGREPVIGTNPITFGTPVSGAAPVLLDMATSVVARGKIVEKSKRGEAIPEGWALDGDGRPTTDARSAEAGVVLPMSGPKGSALAIMVEVLCGVLSGGRFARTMGNLYTDFETPQDVGHFLLLVDTTHASLGAAYAARVASLVDELKASAQADGFDEILMPGEVEVRRARKSGAEGISLPQNVVDELATLATRLGVAKLPTATEPPRPDASTAAVSEP